MLIEAGSVLVLYTDGLVESRTRDVDTGVAQLELSLINALTHAPANAAANAAAHLEELCARALLVAGDPQAQHDDVALLAVRLDRPDPADLLIVHLADRPEAVPQARAAVRSRLSAWQVESEAARVCHLLVSELVTNAIRHSAGSASGTMQLRMRRGMTTLVIEVADPDPRIPRLLSRPAASLEVHGRGLLVVDELATRWGGRPNGNGKVVWCELPY